MAIRTPAPGKPVSPTCAGAPGAPSEPAPPGSAHPPPRPRRNILRLINAFDLPEQSISRDDYAAALARLNVSQPARVAGLPPEACRLEDFPDKVRGGCGGAAGGCRR